MAKIKDKDIIAFLEQEVNWDVAVIRYVKDAIREDRTTLPENLPLRDAGNFLWKLAVKYAKKIGVATNEGAWVDIESDASYIYNSVQDLYPIVFKRKLKRYTLKLMCLNPFEDSWCFPLICIKDFNIK